MYSKLWRFQSDSDDEDEPSEEENWDVKDIVFVVDALVALKRDPDLCWQEQEDAQEQEEHWRIHDLSEVMVTATL